MLKAVIVDDEVKSRRILKQMVNEYCPTVEVVDLAEDVLSGVKAINKHQPDIVFLDIEMPNYSGFKLIEFFDEINFEIIFTTAYEKYAKRAFEVNAIDYLLKPIDIDDLVKAIKRVETKQFKSGEPKKFQQFLKSPSPKLERFTLPAQNGLLYVHVDEVCYLESKGRYTNLFLLSGEEVITTLSMKECETLFKHTLLLRVHRSFMVNIQFVSKYSKGKDSFVLLENKQRIDVGRNYKEELSEIMVNISK